MAHNPTILTNQFWGTDAFASNLYPWLWQTFHLVDSMMITTQAIWRSRPPVGLESVKQADEWKAEPTHWSNSERGWKMVSRCLKWMDRSHSRHLIICLFNAAELQSATPVGIWLLPRICASLNEIWICGQYSQQTLSSSLGHLARFKVSLKPFQRKCRKVQL